MLTSQHLADWGCRRYRLRGHVTSVWRREFSECRQVGRGWVGRRACASPRRSHLRGRRLATNFNQRTRTYLAPSLMCVPVVPRYLKHYFEVYMYGNALLSTFWRAESRTAHPHTYCRTESTFWVHRLRVSSEPPGSDIDSSSTVTCYDGLPTYPCDCFVWKLPV